MKKYMALVLIAAVLFAACENGADAPLETDGLARIRIGLAGSARSVLPVAPALEDIVWFTLYGTASGKEPSDPGYTESRLADFIYEDGAFYDYSRGTEAVVYVKPGTWRLTLYAYDEDGVTMLKGTEIVDITAGFNETVNFTLSPYISEESGEGSVSIHIELPEGSDVASVETTIDGEPLDPPLEVDNGSIIYKDTESPAGTYLFSFTLKDSAGKTVAVISDIVIVATGAESATEYILDEEDINGPPPAPSDFIAESYDVESKSLHFTWRDNSFNETGFTLSDGSAAYTIAAAAQSFDLSASAAPATYTLKAFNAFGESPAVQTSGTFAITFDADNGSAETQALQVNIGGSVGEDMPDDPTRNGYTFEGWYTERNGGGEEFAADTVVFRNMTIYAKWTIVQYTVTFDADGGSPETQTRTVDSGGSLGSSNMPVEPAKSGYAFGGWHTQRNGGGSEFAADTEVTADITVYARWTAVQYTVTFNADGGSPETQTRTADNGGSVGSSNMPSEPVKSERVFGGWHTQRNGGGSEFTADTKVTADITVYARWDTFTPVPAATLQAALTWLASNAIEGVEYAITVSANESIGPKTLSYEKNVSVTLNGGTAERIISLNSSGSLFTVESGVTLTLGNNITLQGRSGNTASLVYVNSGGTLAMGNGSKISGNAASNYGGGVYVNSGTFTMSGGTITGNTASYGGGVYVNSNGTFTMSGGTITGNTASNYGGGVFVNSNGTFAKQSDGVIYGSNGGAALKNTAANGNNYGHAVYVNSSKKRDTTVGEGATLNSSSSGASGGWVEQYTVTFDADGGSPETQTRTVNSGGSVGSLPDEPSKSEYAFGGWYTGRNGGGSQFTASTTVSADITVYAKWRVTVTFDADGGSPETQTRTVDSGGSLGSSNMPVEPTKSGYAFGGWYTELNGGGSQFTAATAVNVNSTAYAKWRVTITFDADGGSPETQTRTADSGGSLGSSNMPVEPAKSGYAFGGWHTQRNGGGREFAEDTVVTASRTVYAKWRVTVTFDADGGSPETQTRTMDIGASVGSSNMPLEPAKSGYAFGGWYTELNGGGSQFTAATAVNVNSTAYAKWLPVASVQISLRPTQDDPPLSGISLFVNEQAEFSAGSGYDSYTWYWNGKAIADADSSTYILAANSKTPGVYELSALVVTSAGEMLSARCYVAIKAN